MRIPRYRILVYYHGPYEHYRPQVKKWFGWRYLTDRGEMIDYQNYPSIEKCRWVIDKHCSMLIRKKGYQERIIDIEPCPTWRAGE